LSLCSHFKANTTQLAILSVFNEFDQLTLGMLAEKTGLRHETLPTVLRPIIKASLLNYYEIEEGDAGRLVNFNENFSSEKLHISLLNTTKGAKRTKRSKGEANRSERRDEKAEHYVIKVSANLSLLA